MVMISAHRGAAGDNVDLENKLSTLQAAAEMDCELVEFDVQRCKDGTFVLLHDDFIRSQERVIFVKDLSYDALTLFEGPVTTLTQALNALQGKTMAHVDYKFVSPRKLYRQPENTYEVEAAKEVIEIMGADNCIITSLEDRSIKAVSKWAKENEIELVTGLSIGKSIDGVSLYMKARIVVETLLSAYRLKRCRANLVVANQKLVDRKLGKIASKMGAKLLIWTVDDDQQIKKWLKDDRVDILVTNYPEKAIKYRSKLGK